jgi:hypothetical protein
MRNQVVTARMYLIDIEYDQYEAKLTQELQNEGLGATLASLGLTTTASLIPVAQTSRILSGIATGVTGADKAYSEKELLSETMQALQTQMRADRQAQAASIYAKMLVNNGAPTPIDQYTLPMALSDTDHYYDAGTISSSLIGLSKTVSNAEQNADTAKAAVGPNAAQVTAVKSIANPVLTTQAQVAAVVASAPLSKSSQHIVALAPVRAPTANDFTAFERNSLSTADVTSILRTLCVSSASATVDFGQLNSPGRLAIAKFKAGTKNGRPPEDADIINSATAKADESVAGSTLVYLRRAVTIAGKDTTNSRCSLPNADYTLGQQAAAENGAPVKQ